MIILEVGKILGLKVYLETSAHGSDTEPRHLRVVKSQGILFTVQDGMDHGFSYNELLEVIEKADRAEIIRVLGSGFARSEFKSAGSFSYNDQQEFEMSYVIKPVGSSPY